MDGPCGENIDAKNSTNRAGLDNRRECFIIINAMLLRVTTTDPAGFIAGEAPVRALDVGGGGSIVIKHVEDLSGDAGVEPLNNRKIVFHPLRIMRARRTVGGDVRAKVAASQV